MLESKWTLFGIVVDKTKFIALQCFSECQWLPFYGFHVMQNTNIYQKTGGFYKF